MSDVTYRSIKSLLLSRKGATFLFALCIGMDVMTALGDQAVMLDVKLVLVENRYGQRAFLTEAEARSFRDILKRIIPLPGVRPSKAPPEWTWFYYWSYDSATNDLFRHVVSFNDEGYSVNWSIDADTSVKIRTLVSTVSLRMQRQVQGGSQSQIESP